MSGIWISPKNSASGHPDPTRLYSVQGWEARAPPHHFWGPAAPSEEGWQATASGGSGEVSAEQHRGNSQQGARCPQILKDKTEKRETQGGQGGE